MAGRISRKVVTQNASLPLDCSFYVLGDRLPVNNGYLLFASICKVLDDRLPPEVGLFSIGSKIYDGKHIYLNKDSVLRFRLTEEYLPLVLQLSGRSLEVDYCSIMVGPPRIRLVPSTRSVYSRCVTFKNAMDEESQITHAQDALKNLGVHAEVTIPKCRFGKYAGQPQRRIVPIREDKVVGYGLTLSGLQPEDCQRLLISGLGGRRHMGCGIFDPIFED